MSQTQSVHGALNGLRASPDAERQVLIKQELALFEIV